MLNLVTIMGRPVHTPEVKTSQSGSTYARLRIANDRDVAGKDGTKADFFDVTAFGKTAEFVGKYIEKGRLIVVTGRLQSEDFTDKEGNRRTRCVIIADHVYFADSRRDGNAEPPPELKPETVAYGKHLVEAMKKPQLEPVEVDDADLPF